MNINIMYDNNLDDIERSAIRDAAETLVRLGFNQKIRIFGSQKWSEGNYSSAEWYLDHAEKIRRPDGSIQINASSINDLMSGEPWQRSDPHIDIMITSRDLTARSGTGYLNFCFGAARGRFITSSIARYRNLFDGDRYLATKAVILHELGHVFNLAGIHRTNTEENLGPHCTNPKCIMRQGLNVPIWVNHARESAATNQWYCPQCLEDFKNYLKQK